MKKIFLIAASAILFAFCANATGNNGTSDASSSKVVSISESAYKTQIEDFTTSEWKYIGKGPAIVDFYADWCGPCRRVAPILEKLAAEYGSKLTIYKVDVDNAGNLAKAYGISSIPTIMFIPEGGDPYKTVGALSEEKIKELVADKLGVK